MECNLFQVDAFPAVPFKGNSAAVCLLNQKPNEQWMQDLASEMNLAETAFLLKEEDSWNLRWFTPELEVDLCGHATLASAHILYTEKIVDAASPIRFQSRSGELGAKRNGQKIVLDFPSEPCSPCAFPTPLAKLLSQPAIYCGKNRMDYQVELASEADVLSFVPDQAIIAQLGGRCVVITSRAKTIANADFVSRVFCPNAGIPEDPVTGSAHCMLGTYWMQKLGKADLSGYQASKRGGYVGMKVLGARVELSGDAVTVFRGRIAL
jgi:predicted PhzF superfamily epimerase YddE/YHI9